MRLSSQKNGGDGRSAVIDFELLQDWAARHRRGSDGLSSDEQNQSSSEEEMGKPGIANRFTFLSAALDSAIYGTSFADLTSGNVSNLFSSSLWWLNVSNPTTDEVTILCKAMGVHPLTMEDIATNEEREKIDIFRSYYFASLQSFRITKDERGERLSPLNVYAIVFPGAILTFQSTDGNIDHASSVRARLALSKDRIPFNSDWICYALIDDIVDSFAPSIHRLELQTEAIEDEAFLARDDPSTNKILQKISRHRKECLSLMRLLGGKADILRSFAKRCTDSRVDVRLFIDDIQDHVVTMVGNLSQCERIFARSHSNFLAQLSIANIEQGVDTNKTLNKISVLGAVILPLNLISSIWGMNVPIPFQNSQVKSLAPFFTLVGLMAVFAALLLLFARRVRVI